jgi:Methyl-accepting chemotaxis protein
MRMTIGRRIVLGFGLALLFLALIGAASYNSTRRLLETAGWVSHSHRVMENLERLVRFTTDAESGLRGYVLTGAENYLEPYANANQMVEAILRDLRQLTADDPVQQRRLDTLEPTVRNKFAVMDETVRLRRLRGFEAAQQFVLTDRGRREMVDIRNTIAVMIADERALLEKRDRTAESTAHTAIQVILYGFVLAFLCVATAGFLIRRSIVRPLEQFQHFVTRVGEGDLTQRSEVPLGDELGDLAEGLNVMVAGLRTVAIETRAATGNLNAAAMEILASAQQQSASTGEQAAAVQQTNVTMQEISQSGLQIADRAKQVAAASESTSLASRSGLEAVRNTNHTMERIREQAEAVAQNVVTLSEKTQSVGEIIATVNDIAEQSHLLALNAAIEAAAAGEHGRSFAVVAGEIKNLADQSKAATVQVRSILGDIQKGINSSVMLTEESVKRVDGGKQQADVAASTIASMSDSIQESVQAFQQIVAGTNQQQIGFDQIKRAVKDIGQASDQTASSTRELERAASNLAAMGEQLRKSVDRYRT